MDCSWLVVVVVQTTTLSQIHLLCSILLCTSDLHKIKKTKLLQTAEQTKQSNSPSQRTKSAKPFKGNSNRPSTREEDVFLSQILTYPNYNYKLQSTILPLTLLSQLEGLPNFGSTTLATARPAPSSCKGAAISVSHLNVFLLHAIARRSLASAFLSKDSTCRRGWLTYNRQAGSSLCLLAHCQLLFLAAAILD